VGRLLSHDDLDAKPLGQRLDSLPLLAGQMNESPERQLTRLTLMYPMALIPALIVRLIVNPARGRTSLGQTQTTE
jgi:hypothetical protein